MKEKIKRIVCILIVVAMMAGFSPVSVTATAPASSFAGGAGTSASPYQISDAAELLYLATLVNSGDDQSGKYFKLTADISLSGIDWPGIGNDTYSFRGVFDGDFHTVSGLEINRQNGYCVGLFGYAGPGAIIRKVTLRDSFVLGADMVGGIAGCAENAMIRQCNTVNTGVVGASSMPQYGVGGIVGRLCSLDPDGSAYMSMCSTENTNGSGVVDSSGGYAGGIAGVVYCSGKGSAFIENCENRNDIKAGGNAGGIAGQIYLYDHGTSGPYSTVGIFRCSNYGTVKGVGKNTYSVVNHMGGIIGYVFNDTVNNGLNDVEIHQCWNRGNIDLTGSDSNRAGGIVGYCWQTGSYSLSNTIRWSYSTGNIALSPMTQSNFESNPQIYYYGGIAGSIVGAQVYNCAYLKNGSVCNGMSPYTVETIDGEEKKTTNTYFLFSMEAVDSLIHANGEDVSLIDFLGTDIWSADSDGWPYIPSVLYPSVSPSYSRYDRESGTGLTVTRTDNGYTFTGITASSPSGDLAVTSSDYTVDENGNITFSAEFLQSLADDVYVFCFCYSNTCFRHWILT